MHKNKTIVCGGRAYADIDVLACASAYVQLLNLLGHDASAVITGPWNQTICKTIHTWPIDVHSKLPSDKHHYQYVLVDFSDPDYREHFVSLSEVVEVFDHHYGHESYWQEKLSSNAHIEAIGACATLIWEQFKKHDMQQHISTVNANLLYTAIFANTLDFKSDVTHSRDLKASDEIMPFTDLPNHWKETYYEEIETSFRNDLEKKLLQDTKTITFLDKPFSFGQLELWNATPLVEKCSSLMTPRTIEGNTIHDWVINLVSIEEGKCYVLSNSPDLHLSLQTITEGKTLSNNTIHTPRLWLRKEFIRSIRSLKK